MFRSGIYSWRGKNLTELGYWTQSCGPLLRVNKCVNQNRLPNVNTVSLETFGEINKRRTDKNKISFFSVHPIVVKARYAVTIMNI